MNTIKIICLTFLIPFFAFSQHTAIKWETLKENNYSIKYPSTWELNKSGQMGSTFIIYSPSDSKSDEFSENVNLLIQDLSGQNINMDKYVALTVDQINTLAVNPKILLNKRIKKEKQHEYHKMVYKADNGKFHLVFVQYFWIIKEKAYVLTYSSEYSKFESYVTGGEKILNSFKITL